MRFSAVIKRLGAVRTIVYFAFRSVRNVFWRYRRYVYHPNAVSPRYLEFLASNVEPLGASFRLLEVGCNSGAALMVLAERFPEACFCGVDIGEKAIAEGVRIAGSRAIRNVRFLNDDALHLPQEETFDVLCSSATLIYLDEHEIRAFLKQVLSRSPHKILLEEIASKVGRTVKTHFFAHDYGALLRELVADDQYSWRLTDVEYGPWTSVEYQGAHIVIERRESAPR